MTIARNLTAISASLALILFGSISASAGDSTQKTTMHNSEDASVIDGGKATLMRMDYGVYMTVDTVGLTPGNVVTAWFVVFNKPEMCSGGECGEDDMFNSDPGPANISMLRADGLIIDIDGKAQFRAHLPLSDTSEAQFGAGLADAQKAEIHVVIRDHQNSAPGMANATVNSMNGGCPCVNTQFAVFKSAM